VFVCTGDQNNVEMRPEILFVEVYVNVVTVWRLNFYKCILKYSFLTVNAAYVTQGVINDLFNDDMR
jgi:hypothetical protein